MSTFPQTLSVSLPSWVSELSAQYSPQTDVHQRMAFVIKAARENVDRKTGGPFAAAVFAEETGQLIALGINLVASEKLSIAHAEVLALSLAQRQLNSFSLRNANAKYQLVTSSEPCAMCLGAICWSGISSVICGAKVDDAREIGFDEGPIYHQWQQALQQRGIEVTADVMALEARQVLLQYRDDDGAIYNA